MHSIYLTYIFFVKNFCLPSLFHSDTSWMTIESSPVSEEDRYRLTDTCGPEWTTCPWGSSWLTVPFLSSHGSTWHPSSSPSRWCTQKTTIHTTPFTLSRVPCLGVVGEWRFEWGMVPPARGTGRSLRPVPGVSVCHHRPRGHEQLGCFHVSTNPLSVSVPSTTVVTEIETRLVSGKPFCCKCPIVLLVFDDRVFTQQG